MRATVQGPFRYSLALAGLVFCICEACATANAGAESAGDGGLAAAYDAANKAMIPGPGPAKILDQATLSLTPEDGFVPMPEAERLLKAVGKPYGPELVGVVLPRNGTAKWMVAVSFQKLGYFEPGAMTKLSKENIMHQIRRAVRRGNERRKAMGNARLDLGDFIEPPVYDQKRDRMLMVTSVLKYGADEGVTEGANLDAYVFGREGVLTLALATHAGGYSNLRNHTQQLYAGAEFVPGKRTGDVAAADKRVAYPLDILFGGRSMEEIAKEKAVAESQRRRNELIQEQLNQPDATRTSTTCPTRRASLLLSSMADVRFYRATAA